jgi:hypothetical protein
MHAPDQVLSSHTLATNASADGYDSEVQPID